MLSTVSRWPSCTDMYAVINCICWYCNVTELLVHYVLFVVPMCMHHVGNEVCFISICCYFCNLHACNWIINVNNNKWQFSCCCLHDTFKNNYLLTVGPKCIQPAFVAQQQQLSINICCPRPNWATYSLATAVNRWDWQMDCLVMLTAHYADCVIMSTFFTNLQFSFIKQNLLLTRQHAVECIPPKCHDEISTVVTTE